ncbi:MAG: nitrophenyl compound nitroreductase subunit ArsF family protein [Candidatus Micrarchaeia archaeon]
MRLLALAMVGILVMGCLSDAPQHANNSTLVQNNTGTPFKYTKFQTDIVLVKFHRNYECAECVNIGVYTQNTLSKHYPSELASGKISYRDVNLDTDPNNEFAKRYNPYYQSLYIIVRNPDGETGRELGSAWGYANDAQGFENYLKGEIEGTWG